MAHQYKKKNLKKKKEKNNMNQENGVPQVK